MCLAAPRPAAPATRCCKTCRCAQCTLWAASEPTWPCRGRASPALRTPSGRMRARPLTPPPVRRAGHARSSPHGADAARRAPPSVRGHARRAARRVRRIRRHGPLRGTALCNSRSVTLCAPALMRSCPRSADPGRRASRLPVQHDVPRQGAWLALRCVPRTPRLTPRAAPRRRCGARATRCWRRTRTPSATSSSGERPPACLRSFMAWMQR